jgi:succinate dehydrogenase / fumarate reductase cytochrome b subunit
MVGRKIVMSVTGFSLVVFVSLHLLGNSSFYYGPGGINTYAAMLHGLGPFIWLIRSVMLAFLSLHVFFGIQLTLENRKAKAETYAVTQRLRSTFAGRSMIWTGLMTGAFLVYHLLHFTFYVTNPEISAYRHLDVMGRPDVFMMVVLGFRNQTIAFIYILALMSLALHLTHAIQSMFQTVGLNSERSESFISQAGIFTAIILFLGFIAIPISVVTGIVR